MAPTAIQAIGLSIIYKKNIVRYMLQSHLQKHLTHSVDISNFDPVSFFTLHDFNNDGVWSPDEVRRIYGLDDPSLKDTPKETKDNAIHKVFQLFDEWKKGSISKDDWVRQVRAGKKLPDFGLGPGHHGDDEYEYEIHHFEKFHGEDTTIDDLIHPEDIEHFRKHDMMEDEAERIAVEQSQSIVEANIPSKFRKEL